MLPVGYGPGVIAIADNGDALVATGGTTIHVMFRPAGADSMIDVQGAENLTGFLVGLALDPDGTALIVFANGTALLQALRLERDRRRGPVRYHHHAATDDDHVACRRLRRSRELGGGRLRRGRT